MRYQDDYEESDWEDWEPGDYEGLSTSIRAWFSSQEKQRARRKSGEPTTKQKIFDFVWESGERGAILHEIVEGTGIPIEVCSTYVSKMRLEDGVLMSTKTERLTPNGEMSVAYSIPEDPDPADYLTIQLEIKKTLWHEIQTLIQCDGGDDCSCGPDFSDYDYKAIKKEPAAVALMRATVLDILRAPADKHFQTRHRNGWREDNGS